MKKIYFGTNLKMYKNIQQTVDYLKTLANETAELDRKRYELFVIPSYTALPGATESISQKQVILGAQNMAWEEEGQFTGEVSPKMLEELGINLVMIGHSERRHIFHETDDEENKKVICGVKNGFIVLLCIGETDKDKVDGVSNEVLRSQLIRGLKGIKKEDAGKIWIAYEPVWAIGVNGKPASEEYANAKHKVIRECLLEIFGNYGEDVPILYGGSVNPQNANSLIVQPYIDGLFVGRSAWNAKEFAQLIFNTICKLENLNESETSKFYSLQNFLLEVFGKENEKIELDHTNTGEYYFYIYIKDTNINKEYKIEKIESIFFEKKGFDIFVPNI